MPANTSPIFTLTPNVTVGNTITTANTAKDGTGTVVTVFTAGANGAKVDSVLARPTGAATATVLRVFLNNGSSNTTATNNSLIGELTLPTIGAVTEVAAQPTYELPINRVIPAGYKINLTIGTTTATPYQVTAWGADF